MLIPIFILFAICSVVWLIWGVQTHSVKLLVTLNVLWWVGSFVSAYFVGLAWIDREYSENWAMLGFIFIALPYIVIIGSLLLFMLFFVRKWQNKYLSGMSLGLLLFLTLQLMAGFLSG